MGIALIDTNILIDYFNGVEQANVELAYYDELAISVITYMEFVIGLRKQTGLGALTIEERDLAITAVSNLRIVQIDNDITQRAIEVRSNSLMGGGPKIKLPDAIIFATAATQGCYMVTRDTESFVGSNVRQPYRITAEGTVVDINPHKPM
jgi:predicted nucleic acid-binding protein